MIWAKDRQYTIEPFDKESDLEGAILEVRKEIFGPERLFFDVKKRIGGKGKISNIPDAYLIDLSSTKEPKIYVVENELAKHEPLKHIAVQILELSLSFETSPQKVKAIVKEQLQLDHEALEKSHKVCDKEWL